MFIENGFNQHDITRNACMLVGPLAHEGYDWWWHSFTAVSEVTGEERPFFIEFFLCNPALGEEEPVLGQKTENQAAGKHPSYLMVKAGCWGKHPCQLHRFFGWKRVKVEPDAPYRVAAEDCLASETELRGSVCVTAEEAKRPEWMCDAGEMSWELQVDKKIAFNVGYGASKPLRGAEAFEMYWHAEGMKSEFQGSIVMNGERFRVVPETSFGYADKNWGRDFTSPWVWLSSNCLRSRKTGEMLKNSVFDIGGGRPKVYFVPLNQKLLGAMYYEGEEFDFNFSKFHEVCKTQFNCEETDTEIKWHVRQENRWAVMETEIHCAKAEMLLVNYEAPNGTKRHNRLWNGGSGEGLITLWRKGENRLELIDEIEATHVGCEYGEYGEPEA